MVRHVHERERVRPGAGLEYIRNYYGVPARRGGVVLVDGKPATITGASGPHVMLRLQGEKRARPYHPLDESIVYQASRG